jgi:hypothetical protein
MYPAYYAYQLYNKFGNELVFSASDDPDLSVYAATREDGAITVMVINLSLDEKTKALQIGDRTQIQAEMWLFDPDHKVENLGSTELSGQVTIPAQSITLYIVQK